MASIFRGPVHPPESEASGRPTFDAFRGGLRSLGYVEGRNVRIDARWGEGSDERLDRYAAELMQLKPNVVVAQTRAVFSLRRTGAAMPVVFGFSGDPVLAKLVESLARPGGNFTGVSMLSLELAGKRMELVKELMPGLKRVAVIVNPGHAGEQAELRVSRATAQALGIALEYFPVRNADELEAALADILKLHCEAMLVFPDAGTMAYSERIARFTLKTRIPAISGWVPFAENGNRNNLRPRTARRLSAARDLRRQDTQGSETVRSTRRAANQVRVGDKP